VIALARAPAPSTVEETAPEIIVPERPTHGSVVSENTGWMLDHVDWAKRRTASRILEESSEKIVAALGRKGVDLRITDSDVVAISAVTGKVEKLNAYRACRFVPSIAARDRRPMLNAMRLFIEDHEASKYFRYNVVTFGEAVPAGGALREIITDFHRRISKWAAWSRRQGVEVLYRGTEFTRATAAERKMTDRFDPETMLYHPHANLLTWPKRKMQAAEWSAYLSRSWEILGAHWRDNGKIEDASELVKYCFKPNEIAAAGDDELLWLYQQTQKLKIAQPMGPFKEFMADIEDKGEKVVRRRVGTSSQLVREKKSNRLDHAQREKLPGFESGNPTNILLGVTMPMWRHTPWAEPMILVQRYRPGAYGSGNQDRLDEIEMERMAARHDWDRNGAPDPESALSVADFYDDGKVTAFRRRPAKTDAPAAEPYKVHTCRPTVPTKEGRGPECGSDPPRRPTSRFKLLNFDLPENEKIDIYGDTAIKK
jgi:hypothetical protein